MKNLNRLFNWKLAAIAVGVLALAGGGYWWYTQKQASSDVQYRTSKIERGNLQASVSASGAVNSVTKVSRAKLDLTEAQRDLERQQTDVDKNRTVQKGTFTIDAFAGQNFEGEVHQVRKAVQNAMIDMTANLAGMTKGGMKAGITESLEHVG